MRRSILAPVLGVIALVFGSGLVVAGSSPAVPNNGVFWACYDSGGDLRVIDHSKVSTCPKGWNGPVSWNQSGPKDSNPGFIKPTTVPFSNSQTDVALLHIGPFTLLGTCNPQGWNYQDIGIVSVNIDSAEWAWDDSSSAGYTSATTPDPYLHPIVLASLSNDYPSLNFVQEGFTATAWGTSKQSMLSGTVWAAADSTASGCRFGGDFFFDQQAQ